MLDCFITNKNATSLPIILVKQAEFPDFLTKQASTTKTWLTTTQFRAELNAIRFVPDANGKVEFVLCVTADTPNLWSVGHLPFTLPEGEYYLNQLDAGICDYHGA